MSRGPTLLPFVPDIAEVARSLVGVLLAAVLALQWGSPAAAMAAGGTAAIAGATALRDKSYDRVRTVLSVSAAAGLAVLLGALSAPPGLLLIVVVAAWSVGAGLLWTVSADAGLAAAAITVLLVACGDRPGTVGNALMTALLAVLGGLTQVALVAAWPRPRWQMQRAELAGAYRSVAIGARQLAADPSATLDVTPLFTLRDTYRGRYGLPERIAMTLTALHADSRDPATHEALLAAADALEAIGGDGRGSRARADRALAGLDAVVDHVPTVSTRSAHRLHNQLSEAAALRFTGSATRERTRLSWGSPIVRHALRLGAATGVGTALTVVSGWAQGYWIALTVLLVLRPETAHTYTRCVVRVVGTTFGIAVATSMTVLWQPTGVVSAVLAVLFVAVAYVIPGVGYGPLAAAIVFLADIDGSIHSDTLGERLVSTTIGGALAIASHVVLPDRSLVRLYQRAGELLKAEIDYAAIILRSTVHPLPDAEAVIATAWDRVARARSAFEAACGSARADTPAIRRWLTTYRAGINAVTASCAVLEAQLSAAPPDRIDRRFVVAVDDFVDALSGEAPRAGRAWTLDATHLVASEQQLRESAAFLDGTNIAQRVLVAEAETITRHLMTIADAET